MRLWINRNTSKKIQFISVRKARISKDLSGYGLPVLPQLFIAYVRSNSWLPHAAYGTLNYLPASSLQCGNGGTARLRTVREYTSKSHKSDTGFKKLPMWIPFVFLDHLAARRALTKPQWFERRFRDVGLAVFDSWEDGRKKSWRENMKGHITKQRNGADERFGFNRNDGPELSAEHATPSRKCCPLAECLRSS